MNSIRDVWATRFAHYTSEIQKYMRYIFTGHIAIVIVFLLGAGGYQYSEWLKSDPQGFPVALVVALIIGFVLAFSHPVTLLREPDAVYLLPMEKKMPSYFDKALRFTFSSQILLVVVLYVVAIPLINTLTDLPTAIVWIGLAITIVLKYINVHAEFAFRYMNNGYYVWLDRILRFALNSVALYTYLQGWYYGTAAAAALLFIYMRMYKAKVTSKPIPYEHFITIEQNRMMRFYRFANYFTDVPHLRGMIRRRQWLDFIYKTVKYGQNQAQKYLVLRTFIRTNDLFYLWLRLTAISAIVAAFIDITLVALIIIGAMAFATTLQLHHALVKAGAFRMDMLYPLPADARKKAVTTIVNMCIILQAVVVLIAQYGFGDSKGGALVTLIVGYITQKTIKDKS